MTNKSIYRILANLDALVNLNISG